MFAAMIGKDINGFHIVGKLGEGGMAEVHPGSANFLCPCLGEWGIA